MRKRSYTKVVALVSIVAILSLTAPGLFAGETYRSFFTFKRFVETPLHFLYSFLYFTPLYDAGKVLPLPAAGHELLIEVGGMAPEGRRTGHGIGGLLAQQQILEHQFGGKSGLVTIVGGALGTDARSRTIGVDRPARPGGGGDDFGDGDGGGGRPGDSTSSPESDDIPF